jgi:hypothetical protein
VVDPEGILQFLEMVNRLSEFVFSVLLMRDATQPIKKFRLKSKKELFHHSALVSFAFQCGVECLQLRWPADFGSDTFPLCVLRCHTLVDLKLGGFTIERLLTVSLPALKTLHLKDITISTPCFMDLLAGCPILEDLRGSALICSDDNSVGEDFKSVSLPQLIRAHLDFSDECEDLFCPLMVLSNVEFLSTEICKV